jgi:plasmid maintenance system antidote protein VapI
LGLTRVRLGEIIRGKRGIALDTAFHLMRFFDTIPEFWLGWQKSVQTAA